MENLLGKKLEELRLSKKLSLRTASDITGLSHAYIRDLERNINPKTKEPIKPTTDTLQKLAHAYNYPLEELLKLAGYTDVAYAFQAILDDPNISETKKKIAALIRDLPEDDEDLIKIFNVLNALK
ncbi:helix-turn-helix transcriptional regulator [Brevibacillus laterosporus]|uniref:helix-turn-helix domain-containing protein n=1 Tax=Brevibacillus laterosporus TaxID=1465 RepID=UPI003D19A405